MTHFKGKKKQFPAFDLDYGLKNEAVEIGQDDQQAWLKAGLFSVIVPLEGDWRITYMRGDEVLTESEAQAIGLFTQNGRTLLYVNSYGSRTGETIYRVGSTLPAG